MLILRRVFGFDFGSLRGVTESFDLQTHSIASLWNLDFGGLRVIVYRESRDSTLMGPLFTISLET